MSRSRGYVIGGFVALLLGCGKTIATLSFTTMRAPQQQQLALAAGTRVGLAVHAAKYSYSGENHVMLDAELLRAGAVVQKVTCEGFELEGGSGAGCGATHYNSSCSMVVPPGGSDTVRVTTRMQNDHEATFEGLEVRVLQR